MFTAGSQDNDRRYAGKGPGHASGSYGLATTSNSAYAPPRHGVVWLVVGIVVAVGMLALGLAAKTSTATRLDRGADRHLASFRSSTLTTVAKALTDAAAPKVGIVLVILLPILLLLARRRMAAVSVFCAFGGALALTEVAKTVVHEHRPPSSLWLMKPDSTWSFPSGHTTVASAFAVALIIIAGRTAWRVVAVIVGVLIALAVAGARVYLGVHYPLDVLGGMLSATAAGLVVGGLVALPGLYPRLRRLDHRRGRRRAPR